MDDRMGSTLRRGFRFKPTDKELMRYLEAFVLGKPHNYTSQFIAVEDLYGGREPWQIFGTDRAGEPIRYYFTELKRTCEGGSRFSRGVGDGGTWKGQDSRQPILDEAKNVMGVKKSLRYQSNKKSKKENNETGVWLMKEYSLSEDYLQGKQVVRKDFVLCRIKKVSRKTSTHKNIFEDDTLKVYDWRENPIMNEDVPNGVDDQSGVNTGGEMIEGDGTAEDDMNDDVSRLLKVYDWRENPILNEDVPDGVDDQSGVNTGGEMIEGDGTTEDDMNDEVSRLLQMTEDLPQYFTLDDILSA